MLSSHASGAGNLAIITIVFGWVFTAVAVLAVLLQIWARRISKWSWRSLVIADSMVFVALAISFGLVAHTTWAIVGEGLDERIGRISRRQRNVIVRVGRASSNYQGDILTPTASR